MRMNRDGSIISPHYGEIAAIALDPVEKKPLYHFLPGTKTLSIAESGCNFSCDFCQNWELSQRYQKGKKVKAEEIVSYAKENGIPSISYTYTEPLVWQDYMSAVAEKAKENGIRNVMVSNGSFSGKALMRLLPLIDAYNIDLKGDEQFYKRVVHGSSYAVRNAMKEIVKYGSHIEITTLVIEQMHTCGMISDLARFLDDAGISVWHLTRYFPSYRMKNALPTSEEYLGRIYSAIRESFSIPYIYRGNSVFSDETFCPSCHSAIRRSMLSSACPYCGRHIYGIFQK